MNTLDPQGTLTYVTQKLEAQRRAATRERLLNCCRQALSLTARVLALGTRLRHRGSDSCGCAA